MRALVSAASKHGATAEIAEAIGRRLTERGLMVTVKDPTDIDSVDSYDAFVLGSAVYAGRWQKSARHLVEEHAAKLAGRPVWLFSSGPIGNPPAPTTDPVDVEDILRVTTAREHRLFTGSLQQSSLTFGERAIVAALRAEYGDFRDWDDISAWSDQIADVLVGNVDPAR
jgi:menaquinone-dependent protoporphyrinogen oxidase